MLAWQWINLPLLSFCQDTGAADPGYLSGSGYLARAVTYACSI